QPRRARRRQDALADRRQYRGRDRQGRRCLRRGRQCRLASGGDRGAWRHLCFACLLHAEQVSVPCLFHRPRRAEAEEYRRTRSSLRVRWPRAFTLEESVPAQSAALGAFPSVSAPPFAEEEKIASNGELTAAEAELAAPSGSSRPLPGQPRPGSQRAAMRSQTAASSKARLLAKPNRRMCCSGRGVAGREG